MSSGKIFSYEEAASLVEEVRETTRRADERMLALRAHQERATPGTARATKLKEWINTVIQTWAQEIEAIGALPKGLWTVDFDSGQGYYYCWSLNEDALGHYHHYHEGFSNRKPLSDLGIQPISAVLN